MPQMTHSKPIKKEANPTQAWFDGFEKYRERTVLFPHAEATMPKQLQGPVLPGFDQMTVSVKNKVVPHCATFPMLSYRGRQR